MKPKMIFTGLVVLLFATGCSIIPEQKPTYTKDYRLTSMVAKPVEEIPLSDDETEKELAEILKSWEPLAQSVTVKPNARNSGFSINGKPFTDPDGAIFKYAVNPATGDLTYIVVNEKSNTYMIKATRVPKVETPLVIATGYKQNNGLLLVKLKNNKKMNARDIILLSNGFLVVQNNTILR